MIKICPITHHCKETEDLYTMYSLTHTIPRIPIPTMMSYSLRKYYYTYTYSNV